MDLPPAVAGSLPARVYLLAILPDRERTGSWSELGRALRAAALDQLAREGRLEDAGGRPRAAGGPVADPFLESVLVAVRDSKPRRWKTWITRHERKARPAVQRQLADAGVIAVERRRAFGVLPYDRVTLREHRGVKDLRTRTTRALTGSEPVHRLDPELAALAAIAALAKFRSVADGRTRRRHRARVKELVAHGSPALLALKKSLDDAAAGAAG